MKSDIGPEEQQSRKRKDEPRPDIEADPGGVGGADIKIDEQQGVGGPDIKPEEAGR